MRQPIATDLNRINVRQGCVLKQGRRLIFFYRPHFIFLLVLLDRILPLKEGSIFFIRRREYFFTKRGERFFAGREKYFFPSLGKEKSAFFRRMPKGYGVKPYTEGETPVLKTRCQKKGITFYCTISGRACQGKICKGFVNFL